MALRLAAIICVLSLGHLTAAAAASDNVAGGLSALFDLRVLAAVPSKCSAECDSVINLLDTICMPSQCCTTNFQTEYFNCFSCIGSATNQTDYSQAQGDIDSLSLECGSRGVQLPAPKAFPGQNANRMIPSTSARPLVAPSTLVPVPPAPTSTTITPSITATPTSGSMRIGAPKNDISSVGHFVAVGILVAGSVLRLI